MNMPVGIFEFAGEDAGVRVDFGLLREEKNGANKSKYTMITDLGVTIFASF